jgi:hypothetical protein
MLIYCKQTVIKNITIEEDKQTKITALKMYHSCIEKKKLTN